MVIMSNHSSVAKGEAALLACVGQGFPSVEVAWMHNGQTVITSSLISITEEDVTDGERLFKQSFLKICSVETADIGEYTCIVRNNEVSINSSTQLTLAGEEFLLQCCC